MNPLSAFTIARNESVFLPMWLRHYRKATPAITVLDHDSDDGSVPAEFRIPVTNPKSEDVHWLRANVESLLLEKLRDSVHVLFAEADEFLVPNPTKYPGGLPQYLERNQHPRITATGFDVYPGCGIPLTETDVPLAKRTWSRNDRYDKTLIVSEPIRWEVGFHRPCDGRRPDPDPDLLLIHLHYADREVAWERLVQRLKGKTIDKNNLGVQNKITDRVEFDRHFDEVAGGGDPIPREYWGTVL